jgi:hypothetical protein
VSGLIASACPSYRGSDHLDRDAPTARTRVAAEPTGVTIEPSDASVPVPEEAGETAARTSTRFAVLGDYGSAGPAEERVAALVKRWFPEFLITTGDNNYPSGEQATIDQNIGQYFHEFIAPYRGSYGAGAAENRFFPSLGNHDWYTPGAQPYLDYFTLPGNERYYDVLWESVHLFALNSDPIEPDGVTADSVQGRWLQSRLAASQARWQIVYLHHPPYSSSSTHGSAAWMQWPFREWGADLVVAGHDHTYERVEVDGLTYIVCGLGGKSVYQFTTPVPGSQIRYNASYGAALVEVDPERLAFRFFNVDEQLIDEFELGAR